VFADPALRHGNLPGVDVASMLDGFSYHTAADLPGRIRRGTLQAYGENVLAGALAFAQELAVRAETRSATEPATAQESAAAESAHESAAAESAYESESEHSVREAVAAGAGPAFFDVFGAAAVVYGPRWLAAALHLVPLLLCALDAAAGGGARQSR
jgi:hypothetical protein